MELKKRTRWGLERGNIDLTDRPRVRNPDGSVSTVRSESNEIDGKEVLYPTVGDLREGTFGTSKSRNPTILTGKQARDIYAKTGQNLGKFRTPAQADRYAGVLHREQAKLYSDKFRKGGAVRDYGK